MTTTEHDDPRATRPGTPMIGPYSVNQMDDFYAAISVGEVKTTGVMNLMQRLIIAEHCREGAVVVDACCGRGLQLPMLYRYSAGLAGYTGLDVAPDHLEQAEQRRRSLDAHHGPRFPITWTQADVSQPWPVDPGGVDVVIYTSALEHLPVEAGIASLRHAAASLRPGGVLLLSTPNTAPGAPLQHRVHVHEWPRDQVLDVVAEIGLVPRREIGILPPEPSVLAEALTGVYGSGAARLYEDLSTLVPEQLTGPVFAAAVAPVATEILFVCEKPS